MIRIAGDALARRSLFDAVAGRNAPIAPCGDPQGFLLRDLGERACRFPIGSSHQGTRFCAMPVEPHIWRRLPFNGSYCRFHRDWLAGVANIRDDGEAR